MNIYQIHQYTGAYEDFRDNIVGTFKHEHNANSRKLQLMEEINQLKKRAHKCSVCQYEMDVEDIKKMPCYKPPKEDEDEDGFCVNEQMEPEDSRFEIKVYEVEDDK